MPKITTTSQVMDKYFTKGYVVLVEGLRDNDEEKIAHGRRMIAEGEAQAQAEIDRIRSKPWWWPF